MTCQIHGHGNQIWLEPQELAQGCAERLRKCCERRNGRASAEFSGQSLKCVQVEKGLLVSALLLPG